ncbi:MAG: MoxR family ATPase [Deltaproteobacteria bacterium]|nr:MoxR family ATPase [Deltaproteobacteria bacterium]
MDLNLISAIVGSVRNEIGKVVVGCSETVDLLLTSLLSGGHVLLEGVPGTGKTLLVQAFSAALNLKFGRIQFTPDMMPGDVLGTNLFNFQTNEFILTQGPIFTQILLADEINRTPPKTQAALLQAMNERKVTIDRQTYDLGEEFMVAATQNPIEQQGTYPLPEAQLDRFLFKLFMDYPKLEDELEIVRRHGQGSAMPKLEDFGLTAVINAEHIRYARAASAAVKLSENLLAYIVEIVRRTRQDPAIETGASTRAAAMLASAARSRAAVQGRDYALPDDVKFLAPPLLRHRLVMTAASDMDGVTPDQAIEAIVAQVPAPR